MSNSDKKTKKLKRLAKIIDDKEIGIADEITLVEEQVEAVCEKVDAISQELDEKVSEALRIAEETSKQKGDAGYTPVKGKDYDDGKPGKDYVLTEADKKDIASKIPPKIVEKVVERIETVHEKPIYNTKNVVKEVAVTDTPEVTVQKMNTLSEVLNPEVLIGWKDLKKNIDFVTNSARHFDIRQGVSKTDFDRLQTQVNAMGTGTGITDGDKGDITVSSSGSVWTIDANAVTFAKFQQISEGTILGQSQIGGGNVEEITVGSGLLLSGGVLSSTGASKWTQTGSDIIRDSKVGILTNGLAPTYDFQVGEDTAVPIPTGLSATIQYGVGGYTMHPYGSYVYSFTYKLWTGKDYGGTIYWTNSPITFSVSTLAPYGSYSYLASSPFEVSITFDDVGADVYKLSVQDDYNGTSFDVEYDDTSGLFSVTDSNNIFVPGITTTPIGAGAVYADSTDSSVHAQGGFWDSTGRLTPSQWTTSGSTIYYDGGMIGVGTNAHSTFTDLFSQQGLVNFNRAPMMVGRGMHISPDPGQAGITYFNQAENGLGKTYGALMAFYANAANTTAIISLGFEGDYYSSVAWNRAFMSGEQSSTREFTAAGAVNAAWYLSNVDGHTRFNSLYSRNMASNQIAYMGTFGPNSAIVGSSTHTYDVTLGAEKLTNGGFTGNANNWSLAGGFSYGSNAVSINSTTVASTLTQTSANMASALVAGEMYRLSFTLSAHTVGGLSFTCGGYSGPTGILMKAGTYTFDFLASSTASLVLTVYQGYNSGGSLRAQFTVDNISLKRVSGIMSLYGDIATDTSNGMKIGTATTQKSGFWNTAPIAQPTNAIAAATLVGNAGANITDTDTFDGYTLKQIVKALRNMGVLA